MSASASNGSPVAEKQNISASKEAGPLGDGNSLGAAKGAATTTGPGGGAQENSQSASTSVSNERLGAKAAPANVVSNSPQNNATAAEASDDSKSSKWFLFRPNPWAEPVNGSELFNEISVELSRRAVFPSGGADAATLWAVHTHALSAAFISPRLALTSPAKRCGKTTVLNMLRPLTYLALPAANISPAGVFRAIEKWHPTLLIDEADTFFKENEQLRGILNSGHSKVGYVVRCEGKNYEPHAFSTYAAVAIALIGTLPSTLDDRAIVLRMRRADRGTLIDRWSRAAENHFQIFAQKIVRWVDDHRSALEEADPDIPKLLDDRAADNWRCLLAIAGLAGGDWPRRAREAALTLSMHRAREDQDHSTMLLSDLRAIFKEVSNCDRMTSKDICARLARLEHRPWPEWRNSRPITPPQLAVLLSAFRIGPQTIRIGNDTAKGYLVASFRDAFASYLSKGE